MKKMKIIISCVLVCAILLGGGVALSLAAGNIPAETNPFGKDVYIGATDQSKPFFDSVLPQISKYLGTNDKHSISPEFDKLPKAGNSENFQGLGSTAYANINGERVTAEAFYRLSTDSLHDPNAGMGLLIYQCIKYKQAYPNENVEITFSTYRTSPVAAVCVLPESKYYGYMRSLYTVNYDEHGFVRISYMLAEAARMGIKVTLLNQLNSYAVNQYNPTTKKVQGRAPMSYKTYFAEAAKTDCYNKYAPGKKVSDYLDCVTVGWTVEETTPEMQHVKSCTVSHYIATDGTVHRSGLFFTTANLDDNDYLGRNGNGWSQTGLIISDHHDLYRVTKNYTYLMRDHAEKDQLAEFRRIVLDRNAQQKALIEAGRENEIPSDEQILYLGSDTDKVFKLYFTPILGGVDTWDVENNPICEHIDKLAQSEDYIEFAWNQYGVESNYQWRMLGEMLEKAFCNNPNPKNKFAVRADGLDVSRIAKLKVGTQIGHFSLQNRKLMHAKDFLMSYKADGVRHNVSIMTSSNYVMEGFYYRTNSILVIDETEQTGGGFYKILVDKYTDGAFNTNLM